MKGGTQDHVLRASGCGSGPKCALDGPPLPLLHWRTLPPRRSASLLASHPLFPPTPPPSGSWCNAPGEGGPGWRWAGVLGCRGVDGGGPSKRHLGPDPHRGVLKREKQACFLEGPLAFWAKREEAPSARTPPVVLRRCCVVLFMARYPFLPFLGNTPCLSAPNRAIWLLAREKSTKINLLGPETARWGGGLPRQGVVVENFVPSLESLSSLGFEEKNLGCVRAACLQNETAPKSFNFKTKNGPKNDPKLPRKILSLVLLCRISHRHYSKIFHREFPHKIKYFFTTRICRHGHANKL